MLQTRSGRCPNCKEEVLPGAEVCLNCGKTLDWNHAANAPRPSATSSQGASASRGGAKLTTHTAVEWIAYLVGACLLIFGAVALRNQFFQGDQNTEPESPHMVRVQDAERFREQVFALRTTPGASETGYVMGIAMPAASDVLEITLKSDWKTLNYATRLVYAKRLSERWKSLHAPHRAYFSLLDENGTEIGGRGLSGTVWVQEKHEFARRAKPSRAAPAAGNSVTTPSKPAPDEQ